MLIHAFKFEGAGNDFVILDNRENQYNLTNLQIKQLCDRRFGIGADGLMLLGSGGNYDFSMKYYNADGNEGTMCGNGGRCLVAFAAERGLKRYEFSAIDGYHKAEIISREKHSYIVKLKMSDVSEVKEYDNQNSFFLNTGSPHYVEYVKDLESYPVEKQGKYWRWHPSFPNGTNVNFVEINNDKTDKDFDAFLNVRTYERGVEAETYACGTGVTASAIATFYLQKKIQSDEIKKGRYSIEAIGGHLYVDFEYNPGTKIFQNIYLTGPAKLVFDTIIDI